MYNKNIKKKWLKAIKKGEKMSNKNGTKLVNKDLVGYIKNEDNTIAMGLVNKEKKQMKMVSTGVVRKCCKQGDQCLLDSGYGFPVVHIVNSLEEEIDAVMNGSDVDSAIKEECLTLKGNCKKGGFSLRTLLAWEKIYNKLVHSHKHHNSDEELAK